MPSGQLKNLSFDHQPPPSSSISLSKFERPPPSSPSIGPGIPLFTEPRQPQRDRINDSSGSIVRYESFSSRTLLYRKTKKNNNRKKKKKKKRSSYSQFSFPNFICSVFFYFLSLLSSFIQWGKTSVDIKETCTKFRKKKRKI